MSSDFSVLRLVRPFLSFLPVVSKPCIKIPYRVKVLYTTSALFVFLICSHLPLYGIKNMSSTDPFYQIRGIMASSRGTCMELGIFPIVTAFLVMQLLVGSKNTEALKDDAIIFKGAQKLLGIVINLVMAVSLVFFGNYGNDLGAGNRFLIVLQLFMANIIVILWDELLQKGYGFGSGIPLFIATNAILSSGRCSPQSSCAKVHLTRFKCGNNPFLK